ncbi:hypothetical protein [Paenibacillus cremeus]|uniref:Secreted protein n=1 Tax=Paenibacillus cremeus TaxID=2163881 RepID=A0A559JMD2_9BACL|nr:hypothetical protein [Paenibacillus cremeus]TVY01029.1 hypothetical protein FPZ49_32780 [Paenibacillus cremeus]
MKVAVVLLLFAALLSACGTNKSGNMDHMDHSTHQGAQAESVSTDSINAIWKLSSDKPRSKQDTAIHIQIQDSQGKAIGKFDINHEKQMHLIVVNKDLSYFNHIHPDYKGNGQFDITTQFPAGGEYKLIADFIPNGMGATTKTNWITVQGDAAKPAGITPDSNMTKVVDGKEVTLSMDQLAPGKEANITFNIKDAATKKPITNLQQYLGAVGHVVIMSADAEQYLHVHPTEEKATGPDAKFMTSFPKSGIYKIWGQFQHEGKVITVPFVVKVP